MNENKSKSIIRFKDYHLTFLKDYYIIELNRITNKYIIWMNGYDYVSRAKKDLQTTPCKNNCRIFDIETILKFLNEDKLSLASLFSCADIHYSKNKEVVEKWI